MLPLTFMLAVPFAGEPQFPTRTFELAGYALRCDVVDVDHDGVPDLLAEQAGRFRWLKGDGTGQLEAQGIVPGSEGWKRRELADADGDGWLDALATMSGPERLVFVAGDGHGGFAPPQGIDLGTFPLARCADLDHDGDLDCVAWESTTRTLRSYRRAGAGFVPAGSIALPGAQLAALALGDLDGDHEVDVAFGAYRVATNVTFSLSVLHGTGQGTFSDRRTLVGIQALQLEYGDLDRDGRGELLVGHGQARALRHQFARSYSLSWLCDLGYVRIRLADGDGDGDLDLLGGSNLGSVVHLNDGFGRFPGRRVHWTHSQSTEAAFADLDGDGSADVAGPIQGAGMAVTLASSLPTQDEFVGRTANTWPVDAGDIDGDGDLDLLLQRDGILEFAHGDGAGGLQPAGQLVLDPLAVFPFLTAWAERLTDLDGDGDLDLVGRRSSGIRFTQLNGGDGSFDPPADLVIATHTDPSWADFDGDGLVDLLACAQDRLDVHRGLAGGGFANPVSTSVPPMFSLVRVADFDFDGRSEVVVPFAEGGFVRYAWGTAGALEARDVLPDMGAPLLLVGDVNGDGRPDLASISLHGEIRCALANTSGSFAAPIRSGSPRWFSEVHRSSLVRVDRDPWLDLVVWESDGGAGGHLWVHSGRGNGTFSARALVPTCGGSGRRVVVDLDGDGRAELVVDNGGLSRPLVLRQH